MHPLNWASGREKALLWKQKCCQLAGQVHFRCALTNCQGGNTKRTNFLEPVSLGRVINRHPFFNAQKMEKQMDSGLLQRSWCPWKFCLQSSWRNYRKIKLFFKTHLVLKMKLIYHREKQKSQEILFFQERLWINDLSHSNTGARIWASKAVSYVFSLPL